MSASKKGSVQLSAVQGTTGSYILTETHGQTCTGISSGVSGYTGDYDVQVNKIAWGSTGEFHWVNDTIIAVSGTSCGAGPLPVQLRSSAGAAVSTTAINGSTSRSIDVSLVNQGGSAAQIDISNASAGGGATTGRYLAVAGTTNGAFVPVAGSTVGGAIPHVGATTDTGSTFSTNSTVAKARGTTGAFIGTISAKLRAIASYLGQMKVGGTGADGVYRVSGLSADIRGIAGGVTIGTSAELTGFTYANSIAAIAGGVTIGIGSVAVDNPNVIGSSTAGTGGAYGGSAGLQIRTGSVTLKSGVRVKNVHGSGTLTVSYDTAAGSTSAMTGGWQLDDAEEVFVEVDNLNKVYVRGTIDAGINYCYYAN